MLNLFKSIFDLSSGTILAQILGILILPIMTRIYSAEEYGLYSLIVQLSILFGILLNLRQEQNIQLENDFELIRAHIFYKNRFFNYLIFICSAILVLSIYFSYATPLIISIMSGIFLILIGYFSSLHIFERNYKSVGFAELLNKLVFSIFAIISIKFFSLFNLGMAYLLGLFIKSRFLFSRAEIKWKTPKEHSYVLSKHAGYSASISHILLAATSLIPMFTINQFFSTEDLGYYSLAVSVIFLPGSIISISIGSIFFERLIKEKDKFYRLFGNIFAIALILSTIIFVPFIFFGEIIFGVFLGSEWSQAGHYASILAFPALIGFITGCFDRTCFIVENNFHAPIWHFFRALFTLIASYYCLKNNLTIEVFIYVLSVGQIILYLADLTLQIYYGHKL